MPSTNFQNALCQAEAQVAEIIADELRSDARAKLSAVNKACQTLINSGGVITVRNVRAWIAVHDPQNLPANQTFYNKSPSGKAGEKQFSRYRRILEAYCPLVAMRVSISKRSHKALIAAQSTLISDEELMGISDTQTRYKVQLLASRERSLQTQVNALRQIRELPTIQLGSQEGFSAEANRVARFNLTSYEIEALSDFLSDKAMSRRKLASDEHGTLVVKVPPSRTTESRALSKPFLTHALEKVLKGIQ